MIVTCGHQESTFFSLKIRNTDKKNFGGFSFVLYNYLEANGRVLTAIIFAH